MILPVSAFAEETSSDNATFCFDTDSSLSSWTNFSGDKEAQLTASISDKMGEKGYSLALSTNRTTDLNTKQTGIFFNSSAVGLENFDSCKIQFSYYIPKEYSEKYDTLSFFADGVVWIQSDVDAKKSEQWLTYTLIVPENATNTRVGVLLPSSDKYSGKVAYLDNVIVYNADGTAVANVGDFKEVSILGTNAILDTDNPIISIIQIVIIVVVLVGIVVIMTRLLKKRKDKFR